MPDMSGECSMWGFVRAKRLFGGAGGVNLDRVLLTAEPGCVPADTTGTCAPKTTTR
jgi:hypothetical protein